MGSCPSRSKHEENLFSQYPTDTMKRNDAKISTTELTNVCLEDNSLREITSKLKKALCWTSKHDVSWSSEFCESVNGLFVDACEEISRLAESGDYGMADAIVKMILRLRIAWGSEAFEFLKIKSFPRERIETKSAVILAGQYFKPEQFYESDDRISRLYFFEVRDAESKDFVFTYYLECSNILQRFYVLCLACSGGHLQIAKYGKTCPSYWKVREDMMKDFTYKEDSALAKCGNPRIKPL
ncbi:hypothetical protein ACROYT_G000871 [Oculina patagonica]